MVKSLLGARGPAPFLVEGGAHVVIGQRRGHLEGIADLPAVPASRRAAVIEAGGRPAENAGAVDAERWLEDAGVLVGLLSLGLHLQELLDVYLEDVERLLPLERRVVDADVNPGLESLVEGPHAVGRQEQHSTVILEYSEKD